MADDVVPTADGAQDLGTDAKRWGAIKAQKSIQVKTAGEVLNGGRAVFVAADGKVYMADNTVLAEVVAVIGITNASALSGALAEIVTDGTVDEPGWTWTPGARIYFDNLGALVGTAPAVGHHRSIGVASTATSILVNVGEAVAR